MLGDDAVGPIVATQSGGIDCGTTPENFTRLLRVNKPDTLVIIDAADMGLKPGAVRALHFNELNAAFVTSHGIPLSVILEQFSKSINIIFIGIQPKQTNPGEPLSPEVKAAADFIVEKLKQHH